jgi:hypothetical protein
MLAVTSHFVPPEVYVEPPLIGSKTEEQSLSVKNVEVIRTLSISTRSETTWPLEFVIVQGGPGETQPDGVAPGVSHLLAWLGSLLGGGLVRPDEKILLLSEAVPVILFVISDILTIQGEEQKTLGFQDPAGSTGKDPGEVTVTTWEEFAVRLAESVTTRRTV